MMRSPLLFRTPILYTVTLLFGVAIGCGTSDLRIDRTCESYCAKANECDDDVTESDCVADCKNTIEDCMADEQEQALDDLDDCARDSCDDFPGCTIGAGLQCSFGI